MNFGINFSKAMDIALIFVLVAAGWFGRSWYDQSQEAEYALRRQTALSAFHEMEKSISAQLDTKLTKFTDVKTSIEKERVLISKAPVYRVSCVDDAGLKLLEKSRTGKSPTPVSLTATPPK